MNGNPRPRPVVFLVARREILMRLRSRVFALGTAGMVALVVVGVILASVLAGRTTPTRVGFADTSQALEQAFATSAAALRADVTVSDVTDDATGRAQVSSGTLDVLVTGTPTAPTIVVKDKEILLATVRPSSLLAGKVIGIGIVGLLQLSIVGAATLVAVDVTKVASIPALGPASILGDIAWFLLGFLLYATATRRSRPSSRARRRSPAPPHPSGSFSSADTCWSSSPCRTRAAP